MISYLLDNNNPSDKAIAIIPILRLRANLIAFAEPTLFPI